MLRLRALLTTALLAVLAMGCSESVPLIERVGRGGPAFDAGNDVPIPMIDAAPETGPGIPQVLPLHTESRRIMDVSNRRFTLASVVWYGAESPDFVPYGLDHSTVADIAKLIRDLGFNSVRLPWCNEMFESNPLVGDALLAANPDLLGKRALDVFDAVVRGLVDQGLYIILDNHRSKGEWCCDVQHGDGLWHTPEYPESSWIADWQGMIRRYAGVREIIGADLRDAPRAQLSATASASCTDCSATCPCDVAAWGGSDPATDWPSAAERAGNSILAIRSDVLIIVEGINSSRTIPANIRPIQLAVPNRLVYSPHDYPYTYNGVMNFASYDQFRATLELEWGYLVTEAEPFTAPVWVVFGANHSGNDAQWWGWMRQYVTEKDVDWSYWAVNGTEGNGYTRNFGAEEIYGVLNLGWNGSANADHVSEIQALPR
jgi:endoglucanase